MRSVVHAPIMPSTSLVAAVAPRTGKIIRNGLSVFKEEKIYKIVYYTLCLGSVNRQESR